MDINTIVNYVAIGAGIAGVLTFLVGVLPAQKFVRLQAVLLYYQERDDEKFIKRLHAVYNADTDCIDDANASVVCSFFHHWGLLVKRGLLPIWVFQGVSGKRAVQTYNKLTKFVEERDEEYAEHFRWLKNKIIKKGYLNPK